MPVLDSWYRAEGWRGTGIIQPQSRDQISANNRLRNNASTKPVQISLLAWYRCPVPRQYRWTTSSQVTFRSRASGRTCLCQHYASTAPVLKILLAVQARHQAGYKFPSGTYHNQLSENRKLRETNVDLLSFPGLVLCLRISLARAPLLFSSCDVVIYLVHRFRALFSINFGTE